MPLPVVKGTLDVLVLKALSWQPMHGFEVTAWLEARSGKRLALEDAARDAGVPHALGRDGAEIELVGKLERGEVHHSGKSTVVPARA